MQTLSRVQPLAPADYKPPITEGIHTCFLDIETTGFDRTRDRIVLIGITSIKTDSVHLIQWFNDDGISEKLLLEHFLTLIASPCHLITFNGAAFDLPFITSKLVQHELLDSAIDIKSTLFKHCFTTDLYMWSKKIQHPNLPNRKLKSIETFLSIQREDTISGKESIALYHQWLRTKDNEIRDLILLHNADDILNMYPLWQICSYITPLHYYEYVPSTLPSKRGFFTFKRSTSTFDVSGLINKSFQPFTHSGTHALLLSGSHFHLSLHYIKVTYNTSELMVLDLANELHENIACLPPSKKVLAIDNDILVENLANICDILISAYL